MTPPETFLVEGPVAYSDFGIECLSEDAVAEAVANTVAAAAAVPVVVVVIVVVVAMVVDTSESTVLASSGRLGGSNLGSARQNCTFEAYSGLLLLLLPF